MVVLRYPMYWDDTQATDRMTAPMEALTTTVTGKMVPSSSLGKRHRNRYEAYHCGLSQLTARTVRRTNRACRRRVGKTRLGFRGEQSPQKGLVVPLLPGSNQRSTINPRQRGAERGGSRPRPQKEFTINLSRDQVPSRSWWELLHQDS